MITKNIFKLGTKDIKLILSPGHICFLLLAPLMLFIPNYPRAIGFFYVLIMLMNLFIFDLQFKDREFSSLLPVKKSECVIARVLVMVLAECMVLLITAPFAVLAHRFLTNCGVPKADATHINLTLYAIVLLSYLPFNILVILGAYKKQFKTNLRAWIGGMLFFAISIPAEALIFKSGASTFLSGTSGEALIRQIPVLLGAIIIYAVVNLIVCMTAVKEYEKAEV